MHQNLYHVPNELCASTPASSRADYRRMYARIDPEPAGVLGRHRPAHRLDQAVHASQRHQLCPRGFPHSLVRGWHAQRIGELPGPAPGERAATKPPSSGKAMTRSNPSASAIGELHERVCQCANALKSLGVEERRSRHHLPAHDSRDRHRHARLRPHRRRPFGGVRRLLRRGARRADRGLSIDRS